MYCHNCGEEHCDRFSRSSGWNLNWIIVILLIWALFFHKQKYEGMTAKEWFYEYDEAYSLYEDSLTERDDLQYCVEDSLSWWEDVNNMNDLESMVYDAESCF